MPVDKFGRMSDAKTKDTGVSLTYINNNYIRSDGGTPIANFHGHALSAVSLINKSMKNSMSTVKVREFPEFGEL